MDYMITAFIDASYKLWVGTATHIYPSQTKMETEMQQHELLAFLVEEFTQTQKKWTIFKEEAFAIITVFKKKRLRVMEIQPCSNLHQPSKSFVCFCTDSTASRLYEICSG